MQRHGGPPPHLKQGPDEQRVWGRLDTPRNNVELRSIFVNTTVGRINTINDIEMLSEISYKFVSLVQL